MATKLRRSDTLASIVVGHGYVKHINIVRGNIKASRNMPTLTEQRHRRTRRTSAAAAAATSRQVTS